MNLKIVGQLTPYDAIPLNIRCPLCGKAGVFMGISSHDQVWHEAKKEPNGKAFSVTTRVGMRQCPNPECRAVVFYGGNSSERVTYPPEVIDFDATNLPSRILASLEEAIKCHAAGCYRASALMARRVLEEICADKKAKGGDLKKRIAALSGTVVIPGELLDAADELRLLGNDAAHIEAKDYDNITANEVEVALELAKELLKAVYQYTSLVARLRALKKTTSP